MTTFEDGIYLNDTQEQILDAMVADAKEYFGEDLKDDELAAIRLFYAPIAIQFAIASRICSCVSFRYIPSSKVVIQKPQIQK